jgi:hypothetical protein
MKYHGGCKPAHLFSVVVWGGLQTLHFKQLQGKVEKSCGTEGNILAWKLIIGKYSCPNKL